MMSTNMDHLSNIGEDLILHILSFLPRIHDRARTSLLSGRWRRIWTGHRSICYRDRPFEDGLKVTDHVRILDQNLDASTAPSLEDFRLQFHTSRASASDRMILFQAVGRWLGLAAERGVRRLELCGYPAELDVGTSNLVEQLSLSACIPARVPRDFRGFEFLKELRLVYCSISSADLNWLLSTCHALESFLLSSNTVTNLEISSPSLKDISILIERFRADIRAPNLRSIKVEGCPESFRLEEAKCLTKAIIIDVNVNGDLPTQQELGRRMLDVSYTSHKLSVNSWFFQVVLPRKTQTPIFKNLKKLHYKGGRINGTMLHSLASILYHCTSLEKLSLKFINGARQSAIWRWLKYECSFESKYIYMRDEEIVKDVAHITGEVEEHEWDSCEPNSPFEGFGRPLDHLKKVVLSMFLGTKAEMLLVEYILRNGSALEILDVSGTLPRCWKKIQQQSSSSTSFPAASAHLQIIQCRGGLPDFVT